MSPGAKNLARFRTFCQIDSWTTVMCRFGARVAPSLISITNLHVRYKLIMLIRDEATSAWIL